MSETMDSLYGRQVRLDDGLVTPYGGLLVQAFAPAHVRATLNSRIPDFPRLQVSAGELLDMELIASGALSPLTGFMTRQAYESVLSNTALPDGRPWGLPVTLALDRESASSLCAGCEVALYHGNDVVGVMRVDELFPWYPDREASALYGMEKTQHPQIAERLARKTEYLAGGPFVLLAARGSGFMQRKHLWPLELRSQILQHGWKQVAVPHACYPWRRTHEYLLKCALEYSDALLLHDSIEQISSPQAIPADLVMTASRMLIEGYFPADRMLTNPVPVALCAQHPRAVLQHAILSQNCGASLFFVPEAGMLPGGMADLRTFFSEGVRDCLAIRPVFMPWAFHCDPCGGIATGKSCPHHDGQRVDITDSEIADRLSVGEALPPQVTRPEIARAMARAMSERVVNTTVKSGGRHIYPHVSEVSRDLRQSIAGHKACALWMTGLSGSGKSTIAHRLERELLLSGHRVFVVDGDTLRNGLNRDLGFGEDDRRENLRRAAEVVKVMVEAGMIVIASFISPFRAERQMVREILGASFREVYVEASLEACEQRDPKGLYKRARAGQIPQFTGISSPYESPDNPDVRLDTAVCSVEECVRRLRDDLVVNGTLRAPRDDSRAAGIAALARNSIHIQ